MSALSDIVSVLITAVFSRISQQGFGIPLIVSHSAAWPGEMVRTYNEIADVGVDFATTTPEYKAASKFFAQEPRPPSVKIGKALTAITQRFAILPTVINNYTYRMTVNGVPVTFTSDGTATATEIIAGLKAAIDALALAVTTSDQTTFLRFLANTPNAFFALGSTDANLRIKQDHTAASIAADLAAIAAADNDFYGFVTLFNSQELATNAANWAETVKKLYGTQTEDGNVPNTSLSGTDDIGEALKALALDHTFVIFSPATDDFADAAWLGKCLPYTPGDETWKFKILAGVSVGKYTATQRTNMRAKNVNFYENTQGQPMTEEGISSSGKYIDFVRYIDFITARIGERVFGAVSTPAKLPYNDRGIQAVGAEIRGQLQSDEAREALLPGWTVKLPKASEATTADRAARTLRNVYFSATYAGAIHKVLINGTVTV